LYYGDGNEQGNEWSAFQSPGYISRTFTANKTISNGVLNIEVKDNQSGSEVWNRSYSFNVAVDGVEFNDVTCSVNISQGVSGGEGSVPDVAGDEDNLVSGGMDFFIGYTGLSTTLIWLILMVLVAVGMWVYGSQDTMGFGIIAITETLLLIMGTLFGFLSFGVMLVIVILAIAFLAFRMRGVLTGAGG
jgi:hypothetical protein